MKRGAFDFIVKQWDNDRLISTLRAGYECSMPGKKAKSDITNIFWGSSPQMAELRRSAEKIAPTDATVLITGENGTGKDVLAKEIHRLSNRRDRPMVCVDAGAITETLFESELFGHVKGAFTDAHTDHIGKFEQADGGTLFLDEIGNIPLHLQAKLLRVIQNRTVTRVGSEKEIPIDIRLICATNMNLEEMVRTGHFREDLYYRINTMQLHLPTLRERRDDIIPLSLLFLSQFAEKYHRSVSEISSQASKILSSYRWSGNVRELQNAIEKAVIMSEGVRLEAEDLSFNTLQDTPGDRQTLVEAEEKTIRDAMKRCGGNLTLVAKELGISRPTLYSKLKKYDI